MARTRETRKGDGERFTRTVPLHHAANRAQRLACHVHSQVFVAGVAGRVLCSVTQISTDSLAWKDAYGQEYAVCDILVLPDAHPWCRLDVAW
jgi:hypothetical protein